MQNAKRGIDASVLRGMRNSLAIYAVIGAIAWGIHLFSVAH
jgi:hypothetical protein